ncbi:aminopeptidase [Faecalispora anaeroviscerum]|uniref:aminopeptidase n=1 Tax=Faecalispora anaeroviscerum TaxID=2991836 RepID=UPI0024B893E1|nr:aminopeptidase [Faecalispora anaeroviscerum]
MAKKEEKKAGKKEDVKSEKKSAAEEKTEVDRLREELLINRKNGFFSVTDEQVKEADEYCEGYKKFLDLCKTERECVVYAIEEAEKHGFRELDSDSVYHPGDKVYFNNRGKSIILAVIGKKGCREGVRISAAHIDSPRLDLKPYPLYESNDLALLKSHYYGGIKKYQWTAIPLAMHGRVVRKDGSFVDVRIGEEPGEPQFCVTDLLPHLGAEQMAKPLAKAIEGENLNILVGSRPVRTETGKGESLFKLNVMRLLNEKYGITEEDLVSSEIEFVPAWHAQDLGFDRSMVGAYGHDDRVCAYPALSAILECKTPEHTAITVLADKEEVGSDGNTGLNSSFLRYFVETLAQHDGVEARDVFTRSQCLSADVCAAYDPIYASAYEPANSCYLNNGVSVMKYTGSRGKSGTSDASAEFMAQVRNLLYQNNVLWQTGELGKVDAGGGGTVAMFIANLNVDVVDVGVPVLSMHAPLEITAKLDIHMAYRGFKAFFETPIEK